APLALEPGWVILQGGPGPDRLASPPPFHVLVGEAARLSGWLRELTDATVRLGVGWQSGEVTLPRRCVQAIGQQPGEARGAVGGAGRGLRGPRPGAVVDPRRGRAGRPAAPERAAEPPPARRGSRADLHPGGTPGEGATRPGLLRRRVGRRRPAVRTRAGVRR